MNKLSVVTIVKNEAKNIKRFLNHIKWVDEIVIVDGGSNDKTTELAKKYTDKVYVFKENRFGKLKQFAISRATESWLFILDADEFMTDLLKKEINVILRSKVDFSGFEILRVGYFLNHRLYAKGFHEYKLRLFKKGMGRITQVPIHEEAVVNGKVGRLKGEINHYSYRSLQQVISKFTYYARLEAPGRFEKGERATLKKFTLYPLHMFWSILVEDGGYRDHVYGFALAICFAYMEFMRYVFLLLFQLKLIKSSPN